jgi:hypothetical protein
LLTLHTIVPLCPDWGGHWLPGATHSDELPDCEQHAVPAHCPLQQGWPAVPQVSHLPLAAQTCALPEHTSPVETHCLTAGSQQPTVHASPLVQHAAPG